MATEVYCHGCQKVVSQEAFCEGCQEHICDECRRYDVDAGMHFPEDHYKVTDERQGELL